MARFSLSPPISSSIRKQQQQSQQKSPHSSAAIKTPPQWKWNFPPQDQYYRSPSRPPRDDGDDNEDNDWSESDESEDSSSEESDSTQSIIEETSLFSNDSDSDGEEEEEEEPPHPLGFESRYGRTRFGLSPQSTFNSNGLSPPRDIYNREDEYAWNALIHIDYQRHAYSNNKLSEQSFPPIGSSYHLSHGSVSTKELLRGASSQISSQKRADDSMEELLSGMDRIANLVRAASHVTHDENNQSGNSFSTPSHTTFSQSQQHPHAQPRSTSKLLQLAQACERQQTTLPHEMSRLQQQRTQSYQQSCQGFLLLLQADATRVTSANDRITNREHELAEMEEQERLDKQAYEDRLQRRREEAEKTEAERIAAEAARTEGEQLREQQKVEQLHRAEEEAELEAEEKNAHVARATSLITSLEEVRSGLKEFDKSKSVSRRRLQFKKIVNGKINTLSHDEAKILEVGRAVSEAIANAANDDSSGGEPVTTMGKKYLLDLLCANLIVRVQADGFNGTRGDGFALAAMVAFVSVPCEEIGPVLEGHLYTVCPMAIPALSLTSAGGGGMGDENDLMESLGMIRDKEGEFESFDKFLHRTEGLISIMAEIMSSHPCNHNLLGGHRGALTWLQRFMDLLPPSPTSPLPLLTAPALVAFITGAGHMLANKYPSEFQLMFDVIKNDVVHRLDDSPVGVPSATRLKKVLEGGFAGLKRDLPQGSVAALYDGNTGTGTSSGGVASSPFGQTQSAGGGSAAATAAPSPFGGGGGQSSGFGASTAAAPSPFDPSPAAAAPMQSSGFGSDQSSGFGTSTQPSAAPSFGSGGFGASAPAAASNPPPFGAGGGQASGFAAATAAPSPFGGGGGQSSGFGAPTAAAPSPFGSSPAAPSSGFGASAAAPMQSSGFGGNQSSGFGTSTASAPSPFGSAPAAPSSGFGTSTAAPAPSPFGTTAPAAAGFGSSSFPATGQQTSAFGGGMDTNASSAPSPFGGDGNGGGQGGGNKQPCKFFASGRCNFGDRCKFSHEMGGGTGTVSSNPSPFGNPSSGQPSNAFGGGGGGGSNNKQPCKFFASGSCRHGDGCRFSHETGGGGGGGGNAPASNNAFGTFGGSSTNNQSQSQFGGGFGQSNNPSPFSGGGGNSSGGGFGSSPFGSANTSSGAGFGASPSPFGGSAANTASSSNAFGGPRR